MKKIMTGSVLMLIMLSCNNNEQTEINATTDSTNYTNPTAIDTMQHPNGMTSGGVISTDTAAMKVMPPTDKKSGE